MFKFLSLKPEIFGIDINDLSIKIVKIKKKKNSFVLTSFNDTEIKPGIIKNGEIRNEELLVKAIELARDSVRGKKLDTKHVIVSLPEEKSFLQVIQVPKMTDRELESAVFFEAENYVPLAIDKVYLDFDVVNPRADKDGSNHLDILINAMPKSIIDPYMTCLKKAGLMPCVLEVESQAIVRALIRNAENIPPTILVDFGQIKTSFIIFSGNSIRFTSSISVSSRQITEAVSTGLGIDFDKAEKLKIKNGIAEKVNGEKNNIMLFAGPILHDLADQIGKYADFYREHEIQEHFSSSGKIERVILFGGGASLKGLAEFLSKELKIKVEYGNPFANIIFKKGRKTQLIPQEKELSFVTAIGLAIRGASEKT